MSAEGYDVAVSGTHAYVAAYFAGLLVIDVSNPAIPQQVTSFTGSGFVRGVKVVGSCAYLNGLRVLDISTPTDPQPVGGANVPVGIPAVAGALAYTTGVYGFEVFDISDPTGPMRIGGYQASSFGGEVAVAERYACAAIGFYPGQPGLREGRLSVLDVSDPTSPKLVGGRDTTGYCWNLAMAGKHAYVAADAAGLLIFELTIPTITRAERTTAGLSLEWNGAATGMKLQTTSSLSRPDWRTLLVPDLSMTNRITLPLFDGPGFFRLVTP
jgi:hypothetical protein